MSLEQPSVTTDETGGPASTMGGRIESRIESGNNHRRTSGGPPPLWPFNILLGPALLALIIVAATLVTDSSYASYLSSRLAPSVTLSNGATAVLQVTVDDAAADLHRAAYVLHVPHGSSVTGISYDGHGAIETVKVAADLPAGTYAMLVTVTSAAPSVALAASLQIRGIPCRASPATRDGATDASVISQLSC